MTALAPPTAAPAATHAQTQTRPQPSLAPQYEYGDRKFTVTRITACESQHREEVFLTHFTKSRVPSRCIQQNSEGLDVVRIDGTDFPVKSHVELSPELGQEFDVESSVEWEPIWLNRTELENAQERIEEFERRCRRKSRVSGLENAMGRAAIGTTDTQSFSGTDGSTRASWEASRQNRVSESGTGSPSGGDGAADTNDTGVMPSTEVRRSAPMGSSLPQVSPEFGSFRPAINAAYNAWLRDELSRMSAEPCSMLRDPDVRDLAFSTIFIEKARSFNLLNPRHWRAALIYITGVEQDIPCGRCAKGLAPFPKCVVHKDVSDNTCACCVFSGPNHDCNYHSTSKPPHAHAVLHCSHQQAKLVHGPHIQTTTLPRALTFLSLRRLGTVAGMLMTVVQVSDWVSCPLLSTTFRRNHSLDEILEWM